jgi:hypothetical protein
MPAGAKISIVVDLSILHFVILLQSERSHEPRIHRVFVAMWM